MWLVFVVNHDEAEIFETLADVYLTQGAHFRVSSSKLPSLLQRSSHIWLNTCEIIYLNDLSEWIAEMKLWVGNQV